MYTDVWLQLNTALLVYQILLQFYSNDDVIWTPTRKKHKYRMFDMQLHYTRTCYFMI
jgi:hypothetical protein